jgi:hypothetical protein
MGETDEILKMVIQIRQQARNQRTFEMQANAYLTTIYYQGCIDSLTDVLDNIYKIQREAKNNGSVEVE